jgi:thymidine kinase
MNNQIYPVPGKIKLYLGPMFSGKSSRLIETMRKYSFKFKKTIMINFSGDHRYSEKSEVVTHDKIKMNCLMCSKLEPSYKLLLDYDAIGIDEGQFFSDIVEISEKLCMKGKIVVVAALSGDFKMEPFPNISRLISKADKIKLMKAYCHFCQNSAGFSLRTVQSDETILIGSSEAYLPTCKKCYYEHMKIKFNSPKKEKAILSLKKDISEINLKNSNGTNDKENSSNNI